MATATAAGPARAARACGWLALALLAALPLALPDYPLYVASLTLIYALAAIGLNLTLGYAGQISLAHGAFMGIGAYALVLLTARGVPFFPALATGGILAFACGILLRQYKLAAFAVGALYAGIAGGLFAALLRYIDPHAFGLDRSIQILLMVVVGGLGRFAGPFIGAVVITILPETLRIAQGLYLILFSLLVLLLVLFRPEGLIALADRLRPVRAGSKQAGHVCRPGGA